MKKLVNNMMYNVVSDEVKNHIESLGEIKVYCKLDEILLEREISQKEFSKLTGLREGTISEFKNLKKFNINIGHLIVMMSILELDKITDIIDIEFD